MGKIMRELLKKHEALQLAREVARAKQDTIKEISVTEATTIIAEQYKKAQSLTDQDKGKEHSKIINDILTDKVDIDNYGIYEKDGETLMGVDEI